MLIYRRGVTEIIWAITGYANKLQGNFKLKSMVALPLVALCLVEKQRLCGSPVACA